MKKTLAVYFRLGGLLCLHALATGWAAEDITRSSALSGESHSIAPPPGMVAWWSGDGDTLDLAGQNDGILKDGATYAPGKVGQAFSLGDGSHIEIPNAPELNFSGSTPMTVELWTLHTGTDAVGHLITKRVGPGEAEYQIAFDLPHGLHYGRVTNDRLPYGVSSGVPLPRSTWCHLAGTFDGSVMKLYLNGQLIGTAMEQLGPINNEPVRLGVIDFDSPYGYPYAGLIDEVCLYNRALSAEEIQAIYEAGSAGKFKPGIPVITQQPQNQTVYSGANVFFDVQAEGTPPLFYQWQLNGTNMPNATNSTLLLMDVGSLNSGPYTVVVRNASGSVVSQPANLRVVSAPRILRQPSSQVALWGQSLSLSVTAVGTEPLFYQWYKDGTIIGDATNATLRFEKVQLSDAGTYSVTVSDGFASVSSNPALLTVNPAAVSMGLYPGVTIEGVVGNTYSIQYTTNLSLTNSWIVLTNVTLTNATQLWVDPSANTCLPDQPKRFYLVSPAP